MLEFGRNEYIDWFRVTSDLIDRGVSVQELANESKIPRSTIQGWRTGSRPKLEEGLTVLNIWMKATDHTLDEAPKHNPYDIPQPRKFTEIEQ